MAEVSARKDVEDARRELVEVLDRYWTMLPPRARANLRRVADLLTSAAAKLPANGD
jgi:hypothetical protein